MIIVFDDNQKTNHRSFWVVILAGGKGIRMREAVTQWFGEYIPKQFCTFSGSRSLLQNTYARALQLTSAERIITVALSEHRSYFEAMSEVPGHLLYQPKCAGTNSAIMLATTYILAHDPFAQVLVLPSDHFIYPNSAFEDLIHASFISNHQNIHRIRIFGAEAQSASSDYGYIISEKNCESKTCSTFHAAPVSHFVEKPENDRALELIQQGNAFWSTMIFTAKAQLLWSLCRKHQFEIWQKLDVIFQDFVHCRQELANDAYWQTLFCQAFEENDFSDFSSEILSRSAGQCEVVPLSGIIWDDWGRPERILQCAHRYRLSLNFKTGSNGEKVESNQSLLSI